MSGIEQIVTLQPELNVVLFAPIELLAEHCIDIGISRANVEITAGRTGFSRCRKGE